MLYSKNLPPSSIRNYFSIWITYSCSTSQHVLRRGARRHSRNRFTAWAECKYHNLFFYDLGIFIAWNVLLLHVDKAKLCELVYIFFLGCREGKKRVKSSGVCIVRGFCSQFYCSIGGLTRCNIGLILGHSKLSESWLVWKACWFLLLLKIINTMRLRGYELLLFLY